MCVYGMCIRLMCVRYVYQTDMCVYNSTV
jgi:hypothetical protein